MTKAAVHSAPPLLSQFSKIVPIKTASLRYAVCGCCLCIKNANCYKAISSPWAKTGVLKHNPIHEDMIAVATVEACCAESGVIIMCCSCIDGMGGTNFEKLITLGTPEAIEAYLSQVPPDKTIPEQWAISTTKAVASFRLTSTVSPKRSSR